MSDGLPLAFENQYENKMLAEARNGDIATYRRVLMEIEIPAEKLSRRLAAIRPMFFHHHPFRLLIKNAIGSLGNATV